MDIIDKKILELLQADSTLTTKEIASHVNLSVSPTFERIKRLEKEGYICGYVAIVDPFKVGNGLIVLCNIRLKQHSKSMSSEFVKAMIAFDEVVEVYNTSGDYDYMMKLYVRDIHHYQDFVLNQLGTITSIGQVHSVFVIGKDKSSTVVPVY
ncbi:MAG: Lrp/AsnC family transcriptional regulator [Muribaculaceae bacterium]|nr:Lrp/AsnC family transcriptional regulator [Muribaculaceae bacterium]